MREDGCKTRLQAKKLSFASSPSEVPQHRRVTSKLAQVLAEFLHQFLANALQYLILTRHPLLKQRRSRPLYSAPSQPAIEFGRAVGKAHRTTSRGGRAECRHEKLNVDNIEEGGRGTSPSNPPEDASTSEHSLDFDQLPQHSAMTNPSTPTSHRVSPIRQLRHGQQPSTPVSPQKRPYEDQGSTGTRAIRTVRPVKQKAAHAAKKDGLAAHEEI